MMEKRAEPAPSDIETNAENQGDDLGQIFE